jgi:hypothetical protein
MKIRPWATFTSKLPNDHIEDGPEIIQFGGESVAKAIGDVLRGLGYAAGEPIYANENGWEVYVLAGEQRRRLWCQVTFMADDYLLFFGQNSWIADLFGARHPVYIDALSRLAAALADDLRFQRVRWFDDVDACGPGAPCPVEV